jgi:hypothetical protein
MDKQKAWDKIRRLEEQILFAPPARAAKITKKLVRLKSRLFK